MRTSDQLLSDLKKLHPKLIDLSLGRIERLLARLGNPHLNLPPVVHIAGTNGKGSTAAILHAILEAAGYRVHAYTSPHLIRFHERIVLADGEQSKPIAETALVDVLTRTQDANHGDDITQFEITTAAAFLAFAERPADILLLEVGLGGRLDATNVIPKPHMTIITPVSVDHADKLGNTLGEIAGEKAGILKPGVPAIVSLQEQAALTVIKQRAKEVGAPAHIWGRDYDAHEQHRRLVVQDHDKVLDLPLPALLGRHQIVNAGTAIVAAGKLEGFEVSQQAMEKGLNNVVWPARLQRLKGGPLLASVSPDTEVWLDGGHNPAAGRALAQSLADLEERSSKPLFLIVGMMSLKDAAGFLAPFKGLTRNVIAVPVKGASEAPQEPDVLADAAREAGLTANKAQSIEEALRAISKLEPGAKRIVICGSLYLAGAVLALQEGVEPQSN